MFPWWWMTYQVKEFLLLNLFMVILAHIFSDLCITYDDFYSFQRESRTLLSALDFIAIGSLSMVSDRSIIPL